MSRLNWISRRDFLIGASGLAMAASGDERGGASLTPMPNRNASLLELSAVKAVKLMSSGDVTAERYAQTLLKRCAEQRSLNAFITLEPERVLEAARAADVRRAGGAAPAPLHGLPIPIKDSVNVRGYPTTAGTPALRSFRPEQNAPIVEALLGAGAIVLGKTNLHELSYGWTSNNLAFGAVHNPYDPARIPGGSSGGTAVAVAARMAPLGLAEDTEGSIRVPAAFCGLAALRPTTGRYPTRGAVPISSLFDQVGPHARSVEDLGLFDAVATGERRALTARPLKGVKLAIARAYFYEGLDPDVERVTDAALDRLRAGGVEFVEADVPDLATLISLTTDQIQNHDVRIELPEFLRTFGAGVTFEDLVAQASADIRATFAHDVLPGGPGFVSEAAYRAAVDVHLPRLRQVYRDYFARTGASAMVFPAAMVTAPRIGEESELKIRGNSVPFDVAVARNIAPGSTAGIPGLVLPAGIAADGLPVALEFDAPHGSDRALLELGLSLESLLGSIAPPRLR